MSISKRAKLLKGGLVVLALLLSPSAMYACPMCFQAAASAGANFIHALRLGILVLGPIPFLLGGMIAYMAYRRRDRYNDSPDTLSPVNPHME